MDCIANQHADDVTVSQGSLVSYTRFHSSTVRTLEPLYSWFVSLCIIIWEGDNQQTCQRTRVFTKVCHWMLSSAILSTVHNFTRFFFKYPCYVILQSKPTLHTWSPFPWNMEFRKTPYTSLYRKLSVPFLFIIRKLQKSNMQYNIVKLAGD